MRQRKYAAEFTRCPCGLLMRIGALCPDCARESLLWPELHESPAPRRDRALTWAVAITLACVLVYALQGCV